MVEPFCFRALSPHHPTAMQLEYLLEVVEAASRYGFNAIQICGDTHTDVGNLDGITEFERFARANDIRDMHQVESQRDILRQACRAAHQRGMEVYYWHHELWYPQRLAEVYPDWFVPAPENRFRRDLSVADGNVPRVEPDSPFWEFMDAKFDEAFRQCPELDGTVMTVQEARVPIYCLFEDFARQVESLVWLYERLAAAHRRVGKKWLLRTFAWREHEYRVVSEAIERWRPAVPVESKGVPMDWSLFYPYDPLLGRFQGMTNHTEIAPSCEFHGVTLHPVGHPWFYTENLRFAGQRGHTGAALRIDRAGVSMLGGPDEGVLACIGQWLNDPEGTDVGEAYVRWMMQRYAVDRPAGRQLVFAFMENCWEATLRCYHHGKIYIGDSFHLGYDGNFFLAERDRCVEHDDDAPLAEKDAACAHADQAAAALEALRPALRAADFDDLARRVRFLQLTCRSYRALVAALVARGRQMYEPSEANAAALRSAVDDLEAAGAETSRAFPQLNRADASGHPARQRQPGILVEQFARAFRADLANLPARKIMDRKDAAGLGANAEHQGTPAHQIGPEPTRIGLQGQPGAAAGRHVLVVFAGTEMCVRRPMQVRCGNWQCRFDVGQFAWFLAHDRFRRYEAALPAECLDQAGRCEVELTAIEPQHRPYVREVRLELEIPPQIPPPRSP